MKGDTCMDFGEPVAPGWADHVGMSFVPGRVLDLGDERLHFLAVCALYRSRGLSG